MAEGEVRAEIWGFLVLCGEPGQATVPRQSDNLWCQARRGILGSGVLCPLLSLYPARVRACCESGLWHCPGGPCQWGCHPPTRFWGACDDG